MSFLNYNILTFFQTDVAAWWTQK